MIKWIRKIQWGNVLLIAFVYTIAGLILQQLEALLVAPYDSIGRSGSELYITSITSKFFTGIALCIIYYYLMEYLPKKKWQRTFFFADVLIATSFVFFTIPVYLIFNVPITILGMWFVSSFILILLASIVIVTFIPQT